MAALAEKGKIYQNIFRDIGLKFNLAVAESDIQRILQSTEVQVRVRF